MDIGDSSNRAGFSEMYGVIKSNIAKKQFHFVYAFTGQGNGVTYLYVHSFIRTYNYINLRMKKTWITNCTYTMLKRYSHMQTGIKTDI